ncbi:recombinase family protein [Metaclostridioides mangenotii]|uniref:DNA invertase Pin-like site-specific DNA recombinase n=1 Tax=Metaclostridioides mangenotii TaxID=1540 RepID=A0ABS4E7P1_9FIRM|nr:DNA invertase Pin-like site-specific DNA recombinase [Clostridioides mangenotii]
MHYYTGIDEYEVYEDAEYSGKDTARPAYQDMMNRICIGEITHLLVWKIDRISRNLLDFTIMYEEIKKCNITFVSKNEQFNTSPAMGVYVE